jgi:hypothetical protein
MDPRRNPYAPGAGTPPPQLAGRDELIERAAIALDRIRAGRHARSMIFLGLRGVGKTVLLNQIRRDAECSGIIVAQLEAPEDRSLPAMLAPALRAALIKLDRGQAALSASKRAMRALAGFIGALKVKYGDLEIGMDVEAEKGLADAGDLETDLADLLDTIGVAAAERKTAFVLFIDELQYVAEAELAALITALHRTAQNQRPIAMMAAGLPLLAGQSGKAKSYAERLFEFVRLEKLGPDAAKLALIAPAKDEEVDFTDDAITEILKQTEGYPYFLQEWGKHAWDAAQSSPITRADIDIATIDAIAELDASFFRVRFDRLTPAEKRYLRAMAELGPGPHRSGDVAAQLGRAVSAVAPTRNSLVMKGMVYSPAHGDTGFTVPLFDSFMKRIMPLEKA